MVISLVWLFCIRVNILSQYCFCLSSHGGGANCYRFDVLWSYFKRTNVMMTCCREMSGLGKQVLWKKNKEWIRQWCNNLSVCWHWTYINTRIYYSFNTVHTNSSSYLLTALYAGWHVGQQQLISSANRKLEDEQGTATVYNGDSSSTYQCLRRSWWQ